MVENIQNLPDVPVFCAIDTTEMARAEALSRAASAAGMGIKLGKEFFTSFGPAGVNRLTRDGALPFFLDLKFHDIPNTVAGAVRAACALNPGILNVHASGGRAMLRAAVAAAQESAGARRPLVIAVTLLTSLDAADLDALGITGTITDRAVELARLAKRNGVDGAVCAATEIQAIRKACGKTFKLVVPGIRPQGSDLADQKRTLSPLDALNLGADYLVIGRPISAADDPARAAHAIAEAIAG